MSTFTEPIVIENDGDRVLSKRGVIPESEVRRITVKAVPDTGAWTLVINEDTRQKLGLGTEGSIGSTLADGNITKCELTEAVRIQWKNRSIVQQALVVPDAKDILLGALPLEGMDLMVDPVNECLVGVHGDEPLYRLL
jgi:clan AA aspartic protease